MRPRSISFCSQQVDKSVYGKNVVVAFLKSSDWPASQKGNRASSLLL